MRKLSHRAVKQLAQGHRAGNWQSQDLSPDCLEPESIYCLRYQKSRKKQFSWVQFNAVADSSLRRQKGPDHADFVLSTEESGLNLNSNESH